MLSKTLVLALVLLVVCAYGMPMKTATHEDSWEEKSASVDPKAIKAFLSQFATVKPSVRVNEPKFMQIKTSTATPGPTQYAAPYMTGCGALGNCDHNGGIGGDDDVRTTYKYCDDTGCGTTTAGDAGSCTGESMGQCGEGPHSQICRYCDDTGCCTSDPDGCYCRERYAENRERMQEHESQMESVLASMSCGTCTDCTQDEITTRLAGMGAPPGLTCPVIQQFGFCTQAAPIAPALCPVACAAPCTTESEAPAPAPAPAEEDESDAPAEEDESCVDDYDLGTVPKPWSDFVSCEDEKPYCTEDVHKDTLQKHCAKTCGTCSA